MVIMGPQGYHNWYSSVDSGHHIFDGDRITEHSTLPAALVDLDKHPVLLRTYVSRQAYGKGRALLEALGLTRAQIAKYYGMYPLNEEESVQDGLQAWIGGDINATWRDLLEAMKKAGIAIQQRDGLKKELHSSAGDYIHLLLSLACVRTCVTVCFDFFAILSCKVDSLKLGLQVQPQLLLSKSGVLHTIFDSVGSRFGHKCSKQVWF